MAIFKPVIAIRYDMRRYGNVLFLAAGIGKTQINKFNFIVC